jgi:DNA-binding NarL/FixJ family response regulator
MAKTRTRIRLLIADDERLFRDALQLLLETEPGFKVVGQAGDGAEAAMMACRLLPDVLLLDLAMPRLPGMEALRAVASGATRVRTILLTASMTRADVLTALQLGARGVVMKDASPELLFKSIRAVMEGQYWIDREAVSDLVTALRESRVAAAPPPRATAPERPFNLTTREVEIVRAVVDGDSNKQIASRFGLSEDTVKHHLTSVFDKLGVSTRLELAVFAINHTIV